MLVDCTYVSCTISAGAPSSEISLWVCTQSESSVSSLHSLATLAASLLCRPALCSQYDSIYPKLRTSLSHKWVLYTWLVIVMITCSVKQKKYVPHAWDLMTSSIKSKAIPCESNGFHRLESRKQKTEKRTDDVWLYLDNVLLKCKCSRHGWKIWSHIFSALFWYLIYLFFLWLWDFLFRSHFLHHFEELEYELFNGGKRALNKEIPRWMDPVIIAFPK